jgi:predicted CXXCH cytochrome family protein
MWGLVTSAGVAAPGAEVAEAKSCAACHQNTFARVASQKYPHRPFAEGKCSACHANHLVEKNLQKPYLKAPLGEVCRSCHDTSAQMKLQNKHVPFREGWCAGPCHDPHGSNQKFKLKEDPSEMCLSCHNMNVRYWSKKVQHPPFAQKACLGCHVPHASDYAKNTRLPLPYLCMTCHPIVAQQMAMPVLHPPFSQAWCTMCHNPHATDFPRMAKAPEGSTQPFVDLCLQCHGTPQARLGAIKLHVTHPVGRDPKTGREYINPLTGEQMACVSCHHPHGSPNPRMWLRDRDFLCLSCHRVLGGRVNMPW